MSCLTIGDYLLWNWSLGGNHDVLAVVSGLTLPVLVAAWLWLLALSAARFLAYVMRRPPTRMEAHRVHVRQPRATEGRTAARPDDGANAPVSASASARSSRKLAA